MDRAAGEFFGALTDAGFEGELLTDSASRLALATDNSIYQIVPAGVACPASGEDLSRLMRLAQDPRFRHLKFYPRGGGTSTNGQSLGAGIVVDTSRYMTRILSFDAARREVTVEPGVVRDRLEDFLRPRGFFFAPHVSTTNRATVGGMVSNDSSGKGSVIYGKTSDHVRAVEMVLADGASATFGAEQADPAGRIEREVDAILAPHMNEIRARLPDMKRGFTGYNLKDARTQDERLNMAKLIAGSEGTFGLIASVTLSVEPLPPCTALAILTYPSHDAGLRAIPALLGYAPSAIEFIDDRILAAALASPFRERVIATLGIAPGAKARAAHFMELIDQTPDALEAHIARLQVAIDTWPDASTQPLSVRMVRSEGDIAQVWDLRRACQGLLAGFDRSKRAVAFIEDCAVPPENLADFVAELGALLRGKGLEIGMYGHADVGCVHIRPLMDLTSAEARGQIREISDAVFALTRKYGGLLWGEHGKGIRGEYSEAVLGARLFGLMAEIKAAFDPEDRMNPGKIARPATAPGPLLRLDEVPFRGAADETITTDLRAAYPGALRCDGNGACFNVDAAQALCPSYKATGDRRHSPKTRSAMLREWARRTSVGEDLDGFDEQAREVLDTCLACKACAGTGCPGRVDIPEMKSRFLEHYYATRRRPLDDHAVAALETLAPLMDRAPTGAVNALLGLSLAGKVTGLVDIPAIRNGAEVRERLRDLGVTEMPTGALLGLDTAERARSVVIVQDCFTSFFDADAMLAQVELVARLGFIPRLLTYAPGGKPLHVKGFRARFVREAERNVERFAPLAEAGFPLIGVDAASALIYRHEYAEALPGRALPKVMLLSEWLETVPLPVRRGNTDLVLLQHCTERALEPDTSGQWARIFGRAGMRVSSQRLGCCGMAGLFGHEARHKAMSETLYDQGWRAAVEDGNGRVIATGYSCRSQIDRFSARKALTPARALLRHWGPTTTA